MIRSIFLSFSLLTICCNIFCQKKFSVTLSFPKGLDLNKVEIKVDNGLSRSSANRTTLENNQVKVTGLYYSKYAAIITKYPKAKNSVFYNYFFLDEKPAKIKFLLSAKDSSPFDRYILSNVYDFKDERKKMNSLSEVETREANNFLDKYGDLFDGNHNELVSQHLELEHRLYIKNIEYIKQNPDSYFSFWFFRNNGIYSGFSMDSLLTIFENTFSETIKNSTEGIGFRQTLTARSRIKKGMHAPDFASTDIKGNSIKLSDFKDKKFVLLDFWATWCGPCIEKMPTLGSLHEKYFQELEIISIAFPTSLTKTMEVINREKMTWLNIYNDEKLLNLYGGTQGAIPKLYLIDESGKIIYDYLESRDADLSILTKILEQNSVKGGKE